MDFTLDDTQQCGRRSGRDRAAAATPTTRAPSRRWPSDAGYDETLWKAMAQAGLLSLAVPTALGGDGLGAVEVAAVLTEVGRQTLPLPALATLALGVLPSSRSAARAAAVLRRRSATARCSPRRCSRWRLRDGASDRTGQRRAATPRRRSAFSSRPTTASPLVAPDADGRHADPHDDLDRRTRVHRRVRRRSRRRRCWPATPAVLDRLRRRRRVRGRRRRDRRRARPDRDAPARRASSSAVRSRRSRPWRQEIGDVYITARTVHLASAALNWELANGPRRRRRHRDRRVLAGRRAAGRAADVPSPARRPRRRHHLSAAPLLLAGQGSRPPRRRRRATASIGSERRVHRTDRRSAGRCRTSCARTSPRWSRRTRPRAMLIERHGELYRDVVKRMGRDGWLGVGWPTEFGGRGFGQIEQTIFVNEASRRDIPLPYVTLQTVGPVLQQYGTQEQKDFFLPRILTGDLHFAIGYTEPEAGTDLASLRTSAVRDGDHYIVNGQKVFTTGGHDADYVWLACRTDPQRRSTRASRSSSSTPPTPASRGRRRSPPTARTTPTRPTTRTCGCRCRMLVGEENAGLEADHHPAQPRAGDARPGRPAGRAVRAGARWAEPADRTRRSTSRTCGARWPRRARSTRINELLNWQVASSEDEVDVADASATKVFGSERAQRVVPAARGGRRAPRRPGRRRRPAS